MALTSILKKPLVASSLGVVMILIVHFVLPSYVNGRVLNFNLNPRLLWESAAANQVYIDRLTVSEFSRRPLTMGLQNLLHEHFGIPYQFSFNLIVLVSLWGCCLLLARIAEHLGGSEYAWLSIYLFLFSFTILFGFVVPMHTYDEPLQFLLCFVAIFSHLKGREVIALIALSCACIARETSFLLWPFFLIARPESNANLYKRIALWTIPVICYFVHFYLILDETSRQESIAFNTHHRFTGWTENFKSVQTTVTSLTNAFLVIGIPLILLRTYFTRFSPGQRRIARLAEILLWINTIIVLVAGLAREARLFATPLLLVWPLLPGAFLGALTVAKENFSKSKIVVLPIGALSFVFSFWVYDPVQSLTGKLFQAYLFVYLALAIFIVSSWKSFATRARPVRRGFTD